MPGTFECARMQSLYLPTASHLVNVAFESFYVSLQMISLTIVFPLQHAFPNPLTDGRRVVLHDASAVRDVVGQGDARIDRHPLRSHRREATLLATAETNLALVKLRRGKQERRCLGTETWRAAAR